MMGGCFGDRRDLRGRLGRAAVEGVGAEEEDIRRRGPEYFCQRAGGGQGVRAGERRVTKVDARVGARSPPGIEAGSRRGPDSR